MKKKQRNIAPPVSSATGDVLKIPPNDSAQRKMVSVTSDALFCWTGSMSAY